MVPPPSKPSHQQSVFSSTRHGDIEIWSSGSTDASEWAALGEAFYKQILHSPSPSLSSVGDDEWTELGEAFYREILHESSRVECKLHAPKPIRVRYHDWTLLLLHGRETEECI